MLILAPVVLLILAAAAVVWVQRRRSGTGYAYLVATLSSLLVLGVVIFYRWRLPQELTVLFWQRMEGMGTPYFVLDRISWPYMFSLAAINAAILLTASARLNRDSRPWTWAGTLAITALGFLVVTSGNPLTLLLSWTAIDAFELVILLATVWEERFSRQTVIAFAARVTGTFLVMLAMLIGLSQGVSPALSDIPANLGVFYLLACGLRLGVLPLNLPFREKEPIRPGLENMLQMVAPAASLVVLGRLPAGAVPEKWLGIFISLVALAALYGSLLWLNAPDAGRGRAYWLISIGALATGCAIQGQPLSSVAWGAGLLLVGSLMFLYTARMRWVTAVPLLAALGMVGLPFTPTAAGWAGLLTPAGGSVQVGPVQVVFLASLAMSLVGLVRLTFTEGDELFLMERWIQVAYPAGLILLIGVHWGVGVAGWPGSFTGGIWWAGLVVFLVVVIGSLFWRRHLLSRAFNRGPQRWIWVTLRRLGQTLTEILSLSWLYRLLWRLYQLGERLIGLVTLLLEGDGGILWTLVLLALLISILQAGGI